jgi:hypothetical protein
MPRLHAITLTALRAEQLHQLAMEEYRSVPQQAAYLLEKAIAEALTARNLTYDRALDAFLEADHVPTE